MKGIVQIPEFKPTRLEKFGIFYLGLMRHRDSAHNVFELTDEELSKRIKRITRKGILLSALVGFICVFPTVWVGIYFSGSPILEHYGWVAGVTGLSIILQLYILLIIALRAVFEVSELINIHASKTDMFDNGAYSVNAILSRTALALPDPKLNILGFNPFERVSKMNLFISGLLYKARTFLTNLVLKKGLEYTAGNTVLGISILYEAVPVECFWNCVMTKKLIYQARLRLFGFALTSQIAMKVINDKLVKHFSPLAKTGCLRAIANVIVLAKNYHPNMIILLLRFQEIMQLTGEDKYDDWEMFLDTLKKVNAKERYFLLDLFTVAASFDGKLAELKGENLRTVYENDHDQYYPRLVQLTQYIKDGQLNAALALCKLDLVAS